MLDRLAAIILALRNEEPLSPPIAEREDSERRFIFEMYQECMCGERHFNDLQSVYRKILSVWLIAALTAVGYIASKDGSWPLERLLLIATILLISSLGLALLWCIDLLVYQRLLDAHFFEALKLEEEHPWLPQIHQRMRTIHPTEKQNHWVKVPLGNLGRAALFYSVPTTLFLMGAIFCFGTWVGKAIRFEGGWRPQIDFAIGIVRISQPISLPAMVGLAMVGLTCKLWIRIQDDMASIPLNSRKLPSSGS